MLRALLPYCFVLASASCSLDAMQQDDGSDVAFAPPSDAETPPSERDAGQPRDAGKEAGVSSEPVPDAETHVLAPIGQRAADLDGWACATAAGICTCVPSPAIMEGTGQACMPSDCCFLDPDGVCTCIIEDRADVSCSELEDALEATGRVGRCPV